MLMLLSLAKYQVPPGVLNRRYVNYKAEFWYTRCKDNLLEYSSLQIKSERRESIVVHILIVTALRDPHRHRQRRCAAHHRDSLAGEGKGRKASVGVAGGIYTGLQDGAHQSFFVRRGNGRQVDLRHWRRQPLVMGRVRDRPVHRNLAFGPPSLRRSNDKLWLRRHAGRCGRVKRQPDLRRGLEVGVARQVVLAQRPRVEVGPATVGHRAGVGACARVGARVGRQGVWP